MQTTCNFDLINEGFFKKESYGKTFSLQITASLKRTKMLPKLLVLNLPKDKRTLHGYHKLNFLERITTKSHLPYFKVF